MGQSGGASRWRVCYQRGLPRLVSIILAIQVWTTIVISLINTQMIKLSISLVIQLKGGIKRHTYWNVFIFQNFHITFSLYISVSIYLARLMPVTKIIDMCTNLYFHHLSMRNPSINLDYQWTKYWYMCSTIHHCNLDLKCWQLNKGQGLQILSVNYHPNSEVSKVSNFPTICVSETSCCH